MIKKEYRDIYKTALVILSILLVIPLIYIFDRIKWKSDTDYMGIFIIALGAVIFLLANRLGVDTFRTELEDNAFEYLLTLPISRSAIILDKLLPRLAVIIPPVICYEIMILLTKKIQWGRLVISDFFIFKPGYFPFLVILFLLLSFFTSLFRKRNAVGLLTAAALIVFAVSGFALKALLGTVAAPFVQANFTGMSFLLALFVVDMIIGTAFFVVFRKFDVKSLNQHSEKFVLMALGPLILVSIAAILILLISNNSSTPL